MANILVYGATGFTGQQIAEELNGRDVQLFLSGRNRTRLERLARALGDGVDIRVAPADDREALKTAFDGIDVVISAAGPFSEFGENVISAALSSNAHYVDTTGEQAFMHGAETRFNELARRRNLVLSCAMAFEYALGECASSIAAHHLGKHIDLLETFYKSGKGGVSKGTAKSILRALSSPMFAWEKGRLKQEEFAQIATEITFLNDEHYRQAVSFGGGVPLHAEAYGRIREARSFLVLREDVIRRISRLRRGVRILRFDLAKRLVDRVIDWKIPDSGPNTRDTTFKVAARARTAGRSVQVCVCGRDPYRATAAIAVEGAMRIAAGEHSRVGAHPVSTLFKPEVFLDALAPAGVTWSVADE